MQAINQAAEGATATLDLGSGLTVRAVPFDAPWEWLAAGWRDLWSAPGISLGYGATFAVIAALLMWGMTQAGLQSLMMALAGGFMLVGPLVAVGLYEVSRRLEKGEPVSVGALLDAKRMALGRLAFFGVVLMLFFMVWMQIAFLLFMLFTSSNALPPIDQFMHTLLFTGRGLGLLVVGTVVGALIGLTVFIISAVSVPLLMEKDIDVVTAVAVSINAVRASPAAMLLWAALIGGFMAAGIVTLFVGLVFAFPLIGHATWHAYRDVVRVSE